MRIIFTFTFNSYLYLCFVNNVQMSVYMLIYYTNFVYQI